MQPWETQTNDTLLSLNGTQGYFQFTASDNTNSFQFSDFNFKITPYSISIDEVDYSNHIFQLFSSPMAVDRVIFKGRIFSKSIDQNTIEDKILILHIASTENGYYTLTHDFSYDIAVFYPVYKAFQ